MRRYEKLKLSSESDRSEIVKLLREGSIGLFPTDTVYGICCRMDFKNSVEKIFEIKDREKNKPFLILSDSSEKIHEYIDDSLDGVKKEILSKYWPGPLTVVFKANRENVNEVVRSKGETIAVRVPDSDEIRDIIQKTGVPIVAPSANLSGQMTPTEYNQIDKKITNSVDFIVEGECKMKTASTILDFTGENFRILRKGAVEINL